MVSMNVQVIEGLFHYNLQPFGCNLRNVPNLCGNLQTKIVHKYKTAFFLYFRQLQAGTVNSKNKRFMRVAETGFEPGFSRVESDRSVSCATTVAIAQIVNSHKPTRVTNQILKKRISTNRAVVVVKWSACLLSTPTIRVRIPLKPTIVFCKIVFERIK